MSKKEKERETAIETHRYTDRTHEGDSKMEEAKNKNKKKKRETDRKRERERAIHPQDTHSVC